MRWAILFEARIAPSCSGCDNSRAKAAVQLCRSLLSPLMLSAMAGAIILSGILANETRMSQTLTPREVEKPFRMRWLRMALQLMLRAPVRFSIAILLLGCLDAFMLNLLPGAIPSPWGIELGKLFLPLAWVVVAAFARGADDSKQNRASLASLMRPTVWVAALAVGLGLITLDIVIYGLMFPGTHWQDVKLLSGRVVEFIGAQAWIVTLAAGICFFPLLVLEPALSLPEVLRLSKSATEINGRHTISWFVTGVLCAALMLDSLFRAYGLTMAAGIVFMGVVNYVAYRDIFERQSANSAETGAASTATRNWSERTNPSLTGPKRY
jgi:hypothetical protein